jgi:hypothetical protein
MYPVVDRLIDLAFLVRDHILLMDGRHKHSTLYREAHVFRSVLVRKMGQITEVESILSGRKKPDMDCLERCT